MRVRIPDLRQPVSAEVVSLVLSAATLLVVAAAAVAAIVQLRHLRTSNQLSALLEIMNQWNQPTLQSAFAEFARTMSTKMDDPQYIKLLETPGSIDRGTHPEFLIFDLWEQIGTYSKHGLIDESMLLDIVSSQVSNAWKLAEPAIARIRRHAGPAAMENFEYLAVRSALWHKRYPDGVYPVHLPRMAELGK
jgi:hypothetical protein